MRPRTILVTGATGYIGGRLVPCLLEQGYRVRCLVREPARLQGRGWEHAVDVIAGDALRYDALRVALEGVEVAYYLIHSLALGQDAFARQDRQAATNFGRAARAAGIGRIIYLGGLEPKGACRSMHLNSRLETGANLRAGGVPVTEFRAGVIVGSGSLSFELIRYVTERVPLLICPQWASTPTQPIAVRTVLQYLIEALVVPESVGETFEIGGNDVLSYGDMIRLYARVRGLRRRVVSVPGLTPTLGPFWTSLFTPLPLKVVRPLIEGLDNEVVVRDQRARQVFKVRPIAYEAAVRLALRRFGRGAIETTWHDAISSNVPDGQLLVTLRDTEGMIRQRLRMRVPASPSSVYQVIMGLGGDVGWLYGRPLWRIRGFLDRMVGGVGLRRGRRSPTEVRVGDALDFWRVEAVVQNRLLRLRAEMKVPGRAWLQFDLHPAGERHTRVHISALFEPKGVWGLLYWYLLYPIHIPVFKGMLRVLGRKASAIEQRRAAPLAPVSVAAPSHHFA